MVRRARKVSVSWTQFAARIVALIVLFSAAGIYESRHLSSLAGSEVWAHLRTGIWILENHAIPRTGLFTQYSNLAWNDSSWGFDLLLGAAYKLLGLRAIPILLMLLKSGVAVITFLLAYSGRRDFWKAIGLSAVAQYVISGLQPLPYVFSVLFFAVELQLLVSSSHSGSVRRLYWFIPLFVLWANLHIQFVAGLALLAVFLVAYLVKYWLRFLNVRWLRSRSVPLPLMQVSTIAALCLLATFATPYGFRLLSDFLKSQYSDVAFVHFSGMASMSFRRTQDYVLTLLVMMAFLALGRKRSLELFELLILVAGTALAFRIQRDAWLVVLPAIAVLSRMSFSGRHESEPRRMIVRTWEWGAVAAAAAIVVAIAAVRLPGRDAVMDRIGQNLPVKACDYIVSNNLPAPLFNDYSWGSFLTWYLPEYPVVVDSRVELYGDDTLTKYFDVVGGKERLDSDPMVARAGTLLLDRNSAMAKALRNLPALSSQYWLVYSDEMANVFVPANQDQNR
jgi:hypothetical protein